MAAATPHSLSVGEQVGAYQILGRIGAGGMGVVYKARDLKLDRTVALKFLPHELTLEEKDKQRFIREAKAASALDHPNIGVIHGLEETAEGQLFIVMAYYEGETLAQRIRRGCLSPSEAVNVAMQMARGLEEAHSKHVIHRDIKPSNVILTQQGVAKIVDFGLAQVLTASAATQSLSTSGTPAYMSPEQSAGRLVDERSDIWALGVVLTEMLTQRRPFQGDNAAALVFAIMNESPAGLHNVPPPLQRIIYRALAKDPAQRYQHCSEMLLELQGVQRLASDDAAVTQTVRPKELEKYIEHASASAWAVPAHRKLSRWWLLAAAMALLVLAGLLLIPAIRERTLGSWFGPSEQHVAVLPFENIGNDAANQAVAEGLMDSLTGRLSNLDVGRHSFWVIPASEIRRRQIKDAAAALRELGATMVIEGSLLREGQDVHLTINLINAKSLRQVGSVALEDRAGDFATLQDEAVSRLARLMHVAVTPEMLGATGGAVVPAAYESYLKALGYLQRYDKPGNLDLAINALETAVKTDPRFALGFASIGEAYRLKYQLDRNPKWIDETSANCQRALQLDNRLPAAHVTLGYMHSTLGKDDLSLQEFQQALQLNPRNADALIGMAHAYERMGRIADAETSFKRGAALRPDYWDGYNSLGLFYDRQKRYQESLAQFRHAIELTPDNAQAYSNMAATYLDIGDPKSNAEAEKALKKSIELAPSYPAYANLGTLYYSQQRFAESAAATEQALQLNDKDFRVWHNLGLDYRWLKQADKARAATQRETSLLLEAAKVQPNEATVQSALASAYAQLKLRDKALAQAETALALAPDDPDVLSNVAETYELLGDRRQAIRYLEKAVQKGFSLDDMKLDPDIQGLLADPNFHPQLKH